MQTLWDKDKGLFSRAKTRVNINNIYIKSCDFQCIHMQTYNTNIYIYISIYLTNSSPGPFFCQSPRDPCNFLSRKPRRCFNAPLSQSSSRRVSALTPLLAVNSPTTLTMLRDSQSQLSHSFSLSIINRYSTHPLDLDYLSNFW